LSLRKLALFPPIPLSSTSQTRPSREEQLGNNSADLDTSEDDDDESNGEDDEEGEELDEDEEDYGDTYFINPRRII
jgi:hypothetical protein